MTLAGARCVVLGGGGFLGTNLLLALRAAGADASAFGRPPREVAPGLEEVRFAAGDFADAERVADAVAGADVVFHLLGGSVPAESNAQPAADVLGSLIPSVRLIEACRARGVGRLVFASSGGTVYGPSDADLTEDAPTEPITAYGVNKLAVEKYLGLFRRLHGFDAVALRIANPYGPWQHRRRAQGVVGAALARALAGEPIEIWGDGSVVRDYLHVADVADAMLAAAAHRGDRWVFNVGSGEGRSVRRVAEDVCDAAGVGRETIVHRPGRAVDVRRNVLDPSLIAREMGWRPRIGWTDGLRAAADWMRAAAAR